MIKLPINFDQKIEFHKYKKLQQKGKLSGDDPLHNIQEVGAEKFKILKILSKIFNHLKLNKKSMKNMFCGKLIVFLLQYS